MPVHFFFFFLLLWLSKKFKWVAFNYNHVKNKLQTVGYDMFELLVYLATILTLLVIMANDIDSADRLFQPNDDLHHKIIN